MLFFLIRRLLIMIFALFVVSILSFTIIQLPPGDFLTSYIIQLEEQGVNWSRNKNFWLFNETGPSNARRLRVLLAKLTELIIDPNVAVSMRSLPGSHSIEIRLQWEGASFAVRLTPEELELLERDEKVAARLGSDTDT